MNENEILGFDPSQLTVFNTNDAPKSTGNLNIYKTRPADSKSEDHVYRSTIKIIYNPFNFRESVLEQQSYWLEDAQGGFGVISSLTNNDTNCPVFKAWKKCHFAKQKDGTFKSDEDKKLWLQAAPERDAKTKEFIGGKALFDKRFARYVTIQVLKDENQPELVGKYMLWKLPKVVWELIDAKMNPAKEDNVAPIPVMDFLFGRTIKLTVKPGPGKPGDTDWARQTTYLAELSTKTCPCYTPTMEPLLNDTESTVLKNYVTAMTDVWESEDADERTSLLATINADPNTAELKKIYSRVIEQIKEWCPNLFDELGYHEWTDNIKTRVQNWIDIVLAGNDPKATASTAVSTEVGNEEVKPETTVASTPFVESTEDDDDLPF